MGKIPYQNASQNQFPEMNQFRPDQNQEAYLYFIMDILAKVT